MGSRERLWSIYGEAWGWPPEHLTAGQDREDLHHHADEIERHESFNYGLLDADETELVGCVYIDPTDGPGGDADISWWVRDEYVGSPARGTRLSQKGLIGGAPPPGCRLMQDFRHSAGFDQHSNGGAP